MEEKDLAFDMKEDLLDKIRSLQDEKREERQNDNINIRYYEDCDLKLGKNILKVSIAEITEKMLDTDGLEQELVSYDVYMKYKGQDVLIANINEQGMLSINKELVMQIDPDNELGLLELGEQEKPDLEMLKELDGKTEKELEEELEKEKNARDDKDEKENKKEDHEEIDNEDKEKEEIAKKYNVNSKQVVHINLKEEKITEDKTFAGLVNYANGKEDIYAVPDKDNISWKIVGREKGEKELKEIEQANNQIHGRNPNVKIQKISNDNIEEVKPIAMYDIDGDNAIAIVRNGFGEPEMLYCRKQEGKQEYFGSVVPEASGKNVRQLDFEEREFMSSKNTSDLDLSEKAKELEKANDLNKRGIPSKEEGVQVEEIQGNSIQNRETRKIEIKEDLYNRLGIKEKMKGAMPGYLDYIEEKLDKQADKILDMMDADEDLTYEEAVEKTADREPGGITPGERKNNRGE